MRKLHFAILLCGCLGLLASCSKPQGQPQAEPTANFDQPSPKTIFNHTAAEGDVSFDFLKWDEGLTLLVVDDARRGHEVTGMGQLGDLLWKGSGDDFDGGSFQWQLETNDGQNARFVLNDQAYELSEGALFVVRTRGETVQVLQLKRDLSAVPLDVDAGREYLKKDTEVMKFLETGQTPNERA